MSKKNNQLFSTSNCTGIVPGGRTTSFVSPRVILEVQPRDSVTTDANMSQYKTSVHPHSSNVLNPSSMKNGITNLKRPSRSNSPENEPLIVEKGTLIQQYWH
jgi:hypothetical protein